MFDFGLGELLLVGVVDAGGRDGAVGGQAWSP